MSTVETLARLPRATVEFANLILTTPDATIGATPRDVVWTHRQTTLYRYRSTRREHAIPVLLVFALINRPEIFDLRPGNSFVEYLLSEGYDVYLVDWGVPDEADSDMGLAAFVCDELHWAIRETLRSAGSDELSLVGWCIGGTLCAMYCALHPDSAVRNAVLLTTPIDPTSSLYARWVGSRRVRRRPDRRQLRIDPRRRRRLGQQADEAGDQLRHDLPPAAARGPRRQGSTRRVSVDGQVGGRQPAVPGQGLPRVDHLDVQGEPARVRSHVAARSSRRPAARSSRTCWS